jgi:hypothetical protein
MGRIRSRFVRALVESLQQETSGSALTRLRHGLPPHWLRVLSRDVFGRVEQDAALELDQGIDLLMAIERVLSGGSGKLIVQAASSLAARVLYGSPGLVVPGDFVRTLQHLRAPFEQAFLDADLHFSVHGSALGLVLELELHGLPSAARWLSWTGLGYAQAAASFSGHNPLQFRFDSQLSLGAARVTGRRVHTGLVELPELRPAATPSSVASRSLPGRRRTPAPSLAARVDQILSRAQTRRDAENASPSAAQRPPSGAPARPSEGAPAQSGTRPALGTVAQPSRKRAL